MAPRGSVGVALAVAACALWLLPATASGALRVGFYQNSCPNAEALVRQAVAAAFAKDAGVAAGLIRLHFHDCFVRGCDASVLLTKNPGGGQTEREVGPNNPSLRGFDVIDAAKAAVERSCPRTVSCADIIAFAARDSVKLTGNVDYQVPAGRRDGRVSNGTEALDNLPPPTATAATLADMFANKFLTLDEMVVLSGAHSVGRSFCASFFNRVWTNNGTTPFVCRRRGRRSGSGVRGAAACAVPEGRHAGDDANGPGHAGDAGQQLLQAAAAEQGALLLRQPAARERDDERAGDPVRGERGRVEAAVRGRHGEDGPHRGADREVRRDPRRLQRRQPVVVVLVAGGGRAAAGRGGGGGGRGRRRRGEL
uniref:Peroxidase n=1 Tax=Oryza brachyantha TaxID=4533 RepID=J3KZD2_ORYBR